MPAAFPRLRPLLLLLLGCYLLVYPGSTILVALGRVPQWGTWIGGALLMLQGTLVGLWLAANNGARGALAAAAILLLSWAIEHLGVTTGFPFGSYGYTEALMPKVGGVVPLAIPFAWLLVVPAAISVTDQLMGAGRWRMEDGGWRNKFLHLPVRVLGAASLALLLDMTIEPVAVHINGYWIWLEGGAYYGVPATNFVAWWCTSALLVLVLLGILPVQGLGFRVRGSGSASEPRTLNPEPLRVLPWLPTALFLLNLLMFALVNLAHSQNTAAAIGALLLGYLLTQIAQRAALRRAKPFGAEE